MSKKSKAEIIKSFDPNSASKHKGVFGLPFNLEQSEIVIFPVPWDVTSSYTAGSSKGPESILRASHQVDLYHSYAKDVWKKGICMLPVSKKWQRLNSTFRKRAEKYTSALERGKEKEYTNLLEKVNEQSENLNKWVEGETASLMSAKKSVILLGGDHSTPYGYIKALADKHQSFGVLQIDAHADLRKAYEGFKMSHASIMYNILEHIPQVKNLVQIGVRDYCQEEADYIKVSKGKVQTFFDKELKRQRFEGVTWKAQVAEIIIALPNKIYISFDIDGLDPKLCPNTGTPVPGGFALEEIVYLFEEIAKSGKKVIGMDLNEVAPGNNDWDANVGARILWEMINNFH